jgi:hypothetical protein
MRNRASIKRRAQLRNLLLQPVEHRRTGRECGLLGRFRPPPVPCAAADAQSQAVKMESLKKAARGAAATSRRVSEALQVQGT